MVESIVESSTETVLNVARTGTIKVLHVDDDPSFLKVAKQCLETQGEFEVDTASSVDEALEKLEKTDYHVVVSDYQMLGKDGLELLKELREKGNTVPFIVFTGKGREVAIKALNLGADQYIDKHGDPETVYCELAHAVNRAVDRRSAQIESLKREAKLNAILESSPEAITVIDLNGTIIDCNQATLDVHGYTSKSEVIGQHSFNLVSEKDHKRALEDMKRTLEQGSTKNIEYTATKKDGSEFHVEISGSVIRDPSGNPIGFVSITKDITERRKTEKETEILLHVLGERVKELRCLHGISKLVEQPNASLEEILQGATDSLPSAWQYPDIACSRIIVENQEYKTKNFKETPWKQLADIKMKGKKTGFVEVCYLQEKPTIADGPFLKEERDLIDAIAERLGGFIERKKAEQALLLHETRLKSMLDLNRMTEASEKQIMDFALEEIHKITQSQFAFIGLLNSDATVMTIYSWSKTVMKDCAVISKPMHFPISEAGVWAEPIRQKKPVFINDYSIPVPSKRGYPEGHVSITRFLGIPVFDGMHVVAIAAVANKREDYDELDSLNLTRMLTDMWRLIQRKRTEEALHESMKSYRELAESISDMFFAMDKDFRYTYWNKASEELTGISAKDAIGKSLTEVFPDVKGTRVEQFYKEALRTQQPQSCLNKYQLKGKDYAFELNAYPTKTGLSVFVKDVTERKKTEEELKSSEQKFRGLVEDSAAAIATIDLKGRLTYMNKALADLSGYSIQEMSGRAFKDFVHPDDRGRLVRLFLKIIVLRRQPRKFEFRALRKDGAILHLTCRPTRLETAGKTVGFQAIIMDNTAEKMMLEKVEKMNEKLSVVGGLTRHDVNNKLSVILNVSFLLKQRLRDNQSLELVKETESAVHQIEGLFEFARTYEKLGTEELTWVDAEKVFKEAAMLFPSLQDIKIVNDYHGLTVFADSLLRQLFYNLIDNSLKHGEKVGQVRVHYETSEDRLKLIYEDDGIGIPKAGKDKIFKEGYGKDGGHGLYLIKKMCEVYGWTIQETGRQGKGAQFTINMPKAKPDGRPNDKLG